MKNPAVILGGAFIVVLIGIGIFLGIREESKSYKEGYLTGTVKKESVAVTHPGQTVPYAYTLIIGDDKNALTVSVRNPVLFAHVQSLKVGDVIEARIHVDKTTREIEIVMLNVRGRIESLQKK